MTPATTSGPGARAKRMTWPAAATSAISPEKLHVGAIITAAYVFVLASRISEVLRLNVIKLPALLLALALLTTATRLTAMPFARLIKLYVALTVWFFLASLSSVWPGGSIGGLLDVWARSVLVFFAIAYTCVSFRDCKLMAISAASGFLFLGLYTGTAGDGLGGRLAGGTSASDPNYVALSMLIALPICCYSISKAQSVIPRMFWLALAAACVVVFGLTGSRGGFIGLVCMLLVWLWRASMKQRIALIAFGALGIGGALAFLPSHLTSRYTSLTESISGGRTGDESADGSTEARKVLLMQSLRLTFQNPVLGVGPFVFAVAEDNLAKERGFRKGGWHETHNMYTQISSEAGIPALILFLMILVGTLRNLLAVSKTPDRNNPVSMDSALLSSWLVLSVVGTFATGFFLSVAYGPYIPVLAGLSVALHRRASMMRPAAPVPGSSPTRPSIRQLRPNLNARPQSAPASSVPLV